MSSSYCSLAPNQAKTAVEAIKRAYNNALCPLKKWYMGKKILCIGRFLGFKSFKYTHFSLKNEFRAAGTPNKPVGVRKLHFRPSGHRMGLLVSARRRISWGAVF